MLVLLLGVTWADVMRGGVVDVLWGEHKRPGLVENWEVGHAVFWKMGIESVSTFSEYCAFVSVGASMSG